MSPYTSSHPYTPGSQTLLSVVLCHVLPLCVTLSPLAYGFVLSGCSHSGIVSLSGISTWRTETVHPVVSNLPDWCERSTPCKWCHCTPISYRLHKFSRLPTSLQSLDTSISVHRSCCCSVSNSFRNCSACSLVTVPPPL